MPKKPSKLTEQMVLSSIEKTFKRKAPMSRSFRLVTFDRNVIKSEIKPYTYVEALRIKGPAFTALQDEMYHEGCHMLPEFFACLEKAEKTLFENLNIRERITDHPYRKLFYEIIEKLKNAELAVVKNKKKGYKECFTQFYEVIELIEPYKDKFEYVLTAAMDKLISMCHNVKGHENDAGEIIARIFYKYSAMLQEKDDKIGAIEYLESALSLVRGHIWLWDVNYRFGELLHEHVAIKLANLMLDYGQEIVFNKPEEAIDLARRATLVTVEMGRYKNLSLFCRTFLTRAHFFIENENFKSAKTVLDQIKPEILKFNDHTFAEINILFYKYQAAVYKFYGRFENAISDFKKAILLCQTYEYGKHEAFLRMELAKIYGKNPDTASLALENFKKARIYFIDNDDVQNTKTVNYLMANLKADQIMPLYMDMLRNSGRYYCAFYNLRQWKNWIRPFWLNLHEELLSQAKSPLYCLLNEEQEE